MKARVKATGEVVEILPFVRDEYGYEYDYSDLDFVDWEVYRREVAKDCMAQLIDYTNGRDVAWDCVRFSTWAVQAADALIARLKEQKDEQKDTDDGYEYKQIAVCEGDLVNRIEVLESKGWTHITDKWHEEYDCYLVEFKRPKEQKGE